MNKCWVLGLALFLFTTNTQAMIWSSGNANVAKIYSIEYPAITDIGSVITLNGTGFVPNIKILVGDVLAITWNVVSYTQMTAVIPTPASFSATTRDIKLLTQADSKSSNVVYQQPMITGINPSTGENHGGTIITISGSGFAANANVLISGNAATSVHYINSTQITATIPASIPANSTGNARITVVNPSGFLGQASGMFAYLPPFSATGGTVTEIGGYRIHTFTSSGTFTVNRAGNVEYLVVGGGGGGSGAGGGGGGAGGFITGINNVGIGDHVIVVGNGGLAGTIIDNGNIGGGNGNDSVFDVITAKGGGGGGAYVNGKSGGSGGGGGAGTSWSAPQITIGGTKTIGQGNDGGGHLSYSYDYSAGGGGGAGTVGGDNSGNTSGSGGNGILSSISGSSIVYAGGGGGGARDSQGGVGGAGGTGGGGAGKANNTAGDNGVINLGGGGGAGSNGGGGNTAAPGGAGGSGIVIIRYPINQ